MSVAVVTGSNKGIGLAVVRGLCKQFKGTVYLTARSEERGLAAVKELEAEGLNPSFHQLDIGDAASVEALRDFMKEKHGGIDILVNNAGIAFNHLKPFGEQATVVLKTNYWDTKRACEILFPILKAGARVVNTSSSMGFLGQLDKATNQEKAQQNKKTLAKDDLTVQEIDALMKDFETSANTGTHGDHGWPNYTYIVSKIGFSALSRVQQRQLAEEPSSDIVLNHIHPGWVKTDMGTTAAHFDTDRGAQSILYAALLPPKTDVRGEYLWHDCRVVDWVNGPLPAMV